MVCERQLEKRRRGAILNTRTARQIKIQVPRTGCCTQVEENLFDKNKNEKYRDSRRSIQRKINYVITLNAKKPFLWLLWRSQLLGPKTLPLQLICLLHHALVIYSR